jgi:hypothetical protein
MQTAPAPTGSVPPLPHSPSAPGWSGTCTFNTPGTYTFHCDLHPFMTATIVVQGSGTTTGTTATTTTATTTTTTSPTTTVPPPGGGPGPGASPLASAASNAVAVAARQHGSAVRGAVKLSSAGVGGRLTVGVFASGTAVGARHGGLVRVGRLVRGLVRAGVVRFSVALDAAASRALSRGGRLTLTVRISVVSVHGVRVFVTRHVTLVRARAGRR